MTVAERTTHMKPLTLPETDLHSPVDIGPDTQPFWDATARGELCAQRCDDCGRFRFPPSPVCPACRSFATTWTPLKSTPELYSWVIVERATHPDIPAPFCVALAEFPEGVRIPGNLLFDRETENPRAGTPLSIDFHPVGTVHVPLYQLRG